MIHIRRRAEQGVVDTKAVGTCAAPARLRVELYMDLQSLGAAGGLKSSLCLDGS